jgi:DNA-binding MarR family transcriptional regulator
VFRLEDCLAYLASRNAKDLADILEKRISVIGITRVQWMTLYYLCNNKDITQKELALLLGTKEPTVVRLLDRMEKDDLVIRIRKDRRTNSIQLTGKGKELALRGNEIAENFKNDAMKDIPEEYMDTFTWVLDKMITNTRPQ